MKHVTTLFTLVVVTFIFMTSCSTGVESVNPITSRDVERQIQAIGEKPSSIILCFQDSIDNWESGKKFYVTDNHINSIFEQNNNVDLNSISLEGKLLYFDQFSSISNIDGTSSLVICFKDDNENEYKYNTKRQRESITSNYVIPFLVDLDMVHFYNQQLKGKKYYIITPLWYNCQSFETVVGRKFIEVRIDTVTPGNKIYPMSIIFTDLTSSQQYMVWFSPDTQPLPGRNFDSMFCLEDPHLKYPQINNEIWALITEGKVKVGMTKDECRLSLGVPRDILRMPDQGGLHELWYYDGGRVYKFDDGQLTDQK